MVEGSDTNNLAIRQLIVDPWITALSTNNLGEQWTLTYRCQLTNETVAVALLDIPPDFELSPGTVTVTNDLGDWLTCVNPEGTAITASMTNANSGDLSLGINFLVTNRVKPGTYQFTLLERIGTNRLAFETLNLLVQKPGTSVAPEAFVDAIAPAQPTEGVEVTFAGHGLAQTNAPDVTSYVWRSSLNGILGTNATVTNALSAGDHLISFKAGDTSNTWSAAQTARLRVNARPVAAITSATVREVGPRDEVFFEGTGSDTDGRIAAYRWSFDGTNVISTRRSFSTAYVPPDAPTISLQVQDDWGAWSAPVTAVQPALFSRGGLWKYLDDGTDLGADWFSTNFNDSGWSNGVAEFGFGDGDEATLVQTNQITTYFRRAFVVPDPAAITNLLLRVLRDDGVIVYLNGTEIFRDNLPDPVNWQTPASSEVEGTDERTFLQTNVNTNLLVAGTNIVAAELHASSPANSDLSFDLALTANVPPPPPQVVIISPADGSVLRTPVNNNDRITIRATASFPFGSVSQVKFLVNNSELGEALIPPYVPPYAFQWNNVATGYYTLKAVAQDNGAGLSVTSAPVHITVIEGGQGLLLAGSSWRYWDDTNYPGDSWFTNDFNDSDSRWTNGVAEFGYGDGDEATLVNTNQITTYFRSAFVVPYPAAITNMLLRVLRDDGIIVYLNGNKIFRDNLPDPVDWQTPALSEVEGTDERTFLQATVDTNLLLPGTNILAAEVHASSETNADLSFDLALVANLPSESPTVRITSPKDGARLNSLTSVIITATASDVDGVVTNLDLYADGTRIGGTNSAWLALSTNLAYGLHVLQAVATDNANLMSTSPPVAIQVMQGLVAAGAWWKYSTNPCPGHPDCTNWTATNFDDTTWQPGKAQFGYNNGDETTRVGPPVVTTYFRHTFELQGTNGIAGVLLRLLRDDGAVVYLNGREAFRSVMRAGVVTNQTLAAGEISGDAEKLFVEAWLSPDLLVEGTNIVAVEVHQYTTNQSTEDLSFDLELLSDCPLSLQIRLVDSQTVELTWCPDGAVLMQAVDLLGPWTDVTNVVDKSYTVTPSGQNLFFRLRQQ